MNSKSTQSAIQDLLTLKVWSLATTFESRLGAELSTMGLSVAAFRLIGVLMLEPDGLRQGEIARRLGVRPPSVSAALARLEQSGMVVRSPDPDDPRARLVQLAPGVSLSAGVDVFGKMEAALTEGFTDEELAGVHKLLAQLTQRLEGEAAP
ncbi:MAG: MarR family transcriptional regulator for hemolysin [Myxococcota bacterium]|jgi:MarR family transcriptional regulator for hemolysin